MSNLEWEPGMLTAECDNAKMKVQHNVSRYISVLKQNTILLKIILGRS